MIKLAAAAFWMIIVMVASTYVGATWKFGADSSKPDKPAKVEQRKTEPVSVPIIADGSVAGYVVAKFSYLVDSDAVKKLPTPPDAFITDEAFRRLYVDKVDFAHLEKYDIAGLTSSLIAKVNQRLGSDVVKDVLVEQFTFVPKTEISR
ncbi:hypothetical protein [Methylocella sp.]|uniref:hypothetical protein n=1 Tax=Methylocella sp. TaxID=1978226 RepID=UPI00378439A9